MDWTDWKLDPEIPRQIKLEEDISLFILYVQLWRNLHPASSSKKYGFVYVKIENDFKYDFSEMSSLQTGELHYQYLCQQRSSGVLKYTESPSENLFHGTFGEFEKT
jgi:hypothetical protein